MLVKTFICNMLHENCYVAYDEISREAAIIDPGFYWDNEQKQLTDFTFSQGLKVKYLLCTHLHFDHIFGVPFVEDEYGIQLSASILDASWIDNFEHSVARFGITPNGAPRHINHHLHDGDKLMLGNESIKCIATPGHSAGGMCFYAEESHMLFVGDTLFQSSIGRTDFADGDYAQLIGSIRKRLLTLPKETIVFPGHGDTTTIGDEKMYNPFL